MAQGRDFQTRKLPIVTTILKERAAEKKIILEFVDIDSALPANAASLKPKVQKQNCSLALAIVRAWLRVKAPEIHNIMSSDDLTLGAENFFLVRKVSENH